MCGRLDLPRFKEAEKTYISEYVMVLAPLAKALDLLQSDKMAYYGVLLPTVATLIEKLQKIKRESKLQCCTPLVDALIGGVKQRFGYVFESRKCLMATACHPMFKMDYILTEQKADTETGLREEVRRLQTPSTSPTADEEEDPVSEDDITSFFPKKKDDRLDEVEVFLKSLDTSLLTAFSSLPKMRRVFIKFNASVPASAACERLFSVGKDIFTAKRNRLSDKNFERLLISKVGINNENTHENTPEMANKNGKETIVNKFGLKFTGSKSEMELDKLKRENAVLKKTLAELSSRKPKAPHSEEGKLLEKILSLETLRERNSQQLLAKDQEMAKLRQQLQTQGGSRTDGQVAPSDVATIQEHLRDALEKNQQWLVYDQQREAYVKAVLARTLELEQQLKQANHALQQQHKEGDSEDEKSVQMQAHYDKLLLKAKKDLEWQREQLAHGQKEMTELRRKYEDKVRELEEAKEQLQGERLSNRQSAQDERRNSVERSDRLRAELESLDSRLAEERKRSADLLLQVNHLQKSLLNQHDGDNRVAVLEQQIQMSVKDFESEKLDRQSLQYQLNKVLKELRKAREQIAKLESNKHQKESRFSEPTSYNRQEFEKLSIDDPGFSHTSPSKIPNLLDESFLECPECRTQYPTSQHRELLAHIDYCLNPAQ
ncbi:hypothetical protein AAFF_G00297300 [Aldrovandia affinis]|uniref:Centrosomal protein of 55 kDa n=1 Tax=Aldrovandia affinis TaxID=143900 RepID=A0AAD7WSK4_9TELE|nr:hypothetical protein AAFF_G00297300 [Aldrovandia affinis]